MGFDIISLVRSKPTYKLTRLEFLVLLSLKQKPLHGYAIMKRLNTKLPGVWEAKSGALYPLLNRMVKKGFISPQIRGGKKKYALTEKGHDAVKQYYQAWDELSDIFEGFVGGRSK